MKSFFSPILSLLVCSVVLFGSTESASPATILPSPVAGGKNSTSLMSMHGPNSTVHVNTSSAFLSISPNATTVHVPTSMPNISSISPNHTSIHHSSMYMTLSSVIMSSSAGNGSIHNSTIHPTPLPTHSINMSSTVVRNASSHFHSINMSSTVVHNATSHFHSINMSSTVIQNATSHFHSINMSSTVVHNATSHILPTMTTPSPSPATSVLPSSSVPPTPTTPPPPLPEGKYSVTKNHTKCLLLWLGLKFTITYKNSTGNKLETEVVLPTSGKADGICKESLSSIRISWPFYSFEAYFNAPKTANANDMHWVTRNVTFTAQTSNNTDFKNANETVIQQTVTKAAQLEWLSGRLGRSLNCSVKKELKTDSITATIEGLRIQPFEVKGDFAPADSCSGSPTTAPTGSPKKSNNKSNTVAIAVGCSLAGLVLIVLIGYFIGKRRSRAGTGYRKL